METPSAQSQALKELIEVKIDPNSALAQRDNVFFGAGLIECRLTRCLLFVFGCYASCVGHFGICAQHPPTVGDSFVSLFPKVVLNFGRNIAI